jgi:hypothetical protein
MWPQSPLARRKPRLKHGFPRPSWATPIGTRANSAARRRQSSFAKSVGSLVSACGRGRTRHGPCRRKANQAYKPESFNDRPRPILVFSLRHLRLPPQVRPLVVLAYGYGAAGAARRNKDLGRQLIIRRVGSDTHPNAPRVGPSPSPQTWELGPRLAHGRASGVGWPRAKHTALPWPRSGGAFSRQFPDVDHSGYERPRAGGIRSHPNVTGSTRDRDPQYVEGAPRGVFLFATRRQRGGLQSPHGN